MTTPGQRLRQAREAAGLSRDDLALGVHTLPFDLSLMARADLVAAAEADLLRLTDADLAAFDRLIETLVFAFADRPARPDRSARPSQSEAA